MRKLSLFGAVAALGLVANVNAAPLATGNTLFPAPGEPDPADGGTVIDSMLTPFNVPGFFEGNLLTEVIAGDANNPLGGLTFTYTLTNSANSPNPIARLTVTNYASFGIDGSYQLPLTGLQPTLIDRTTADVVGFSFLGIGSGQLFPGNVSAQMVLQTNAPAYTVTSASVIDSGAITISTLGPAIPEPGTLGLAGIAAAALVGRRRR